jgi:hypothetical protein
MSTLKNGKPLSDEITAAMPSLPHPAVYIQEPAKTGILDVDGRDIYRIPDRVGFLPEREHK